MATRQRSARKKRRITPYAESTSTVRLSDVVKAYITSKARYNESIDKTLRRLFGIPDDHGNGADAKEGG